MTQTPLKDFFVAAASSRHALKGAGTKGARHGARAGCAPQKVTDRLRYQLSLVFGIMILLGESYD